MATTGIRGAVFIGGTPLVFTNEALHSTDLTTYTIANDSMNTWAGALTVEVSSDGTTWVPATGYKRVLLLGQVVFDVAQPTGTQARASGSYVPLTEVADATDWDLTIDLDIKETNRFRQEWKTKVPVIKGGSGSFNRFHVDSFFVDSLGQALYLVLYIDDTNGYKAIGLLKSTGEKSKVDDLLMDNVSFEVTGAIVPF